MALSQKDKQDIAKLIIETNKKNSDWKVNPLLYIIITLMISFILNFVENRIYNDESAMISNAQIILKVKSNEDNIKELKKSCEGMKETLNSFEKILLVIRTKLSSDKKNTSDFKTWDELVDEYEKEKKSRGGYVKDSITGFSHNIEYPIDNLYNSRLGIKTLMLN